VKLPPGEHHVSWKTRTTQADMISTVLGSCVAACIYDPLVGVGGLNHFMLPHDDEGLWGGVSRALRFGNHAMEALINDVLKRGGQRAQLECKLFGGANVLNGMNGIGDKNCEFALEYVQKERLRLVMSDLGGAQGRSIYFDAGTGKVWRRFVQDTMAAELAKRETKLRQTTRVQPSASSIELF